MKGYSELEIFEPAHVRMLRIAEHCVAAVDTYQPDGELVRCHELARAVHSVITQALKADPGVSCTLIDGIYSVNPPEPIGLQHSWLELSCTANPRRLAILDVYVPGRVPSVQLIDGGSWIYRFSECYVPHGERDDIRDEVFVWLIAQMAAAVGLDAGAVQWKSAEQQA